MDLPGALGCEPFLLTSNDSLGKNNVEKFFDSLNAVFSELISCYPNLLDRIRKGVLSIFDVSEDDSEWLQKVQKRASYLYNTVLDSKLRSIMVRAGDTKLQGKEYLESVGAGITGQPPNLWNQVDEDSFSRLVPQLASQVRTYESIHYLESTLESGEDGFLITINGRQGKAIRQIVRFSSKERSEVERLARTLTDESYFKTNRRILLVAITEAARLTSELSRLFEDLRLLPPHGARISFP